MIMRVEIARDFLALWLKAIDRKKISRVFTVQVYKYNKIGWHLRR
jgi:hypothetical protein